MEMGTVAEDQTLACFADVGGGSVNSVVSENEHFLHFLHGHSFRSKRYTCSIYSDAVFLQITGRTLKSTKFFFMIKDYDTLTFDHYCIFSFNNDKSIDKIIQC